MNTAAKIGHPILSCVEAAAFERAHFAGDSELEWRAMQQAGSAVARAVAADFEEIGGLPPNARLLVIAGKGHNGGDAMLAAEALLQCLREATVDLVMPQGAHSLRPLAARAWRRLQHAAPSRVSLLRDIDEKAVYDVVLDGLFGFRFRPPLDERSRSLLRRVNALPARLRAAVDLPSGQGEKDAFQADFTYATGIVKAPVLELPTAGRIRYLDLGFRVPDSAAEDDRVLTADVLAPLAALRPPRVDKRTYGHLFVIGGSRSYPGAVLMSVLAALRSGVGLVTAFVPASLAPAFAARAPEAIWVGWPETPDGGLAMEGTHLLRERLSRANALLIGPGLDREPETLAWVEQAMKACQLPVVLDADALQPAIIEAARGPCIVTPHAGEFARIAGQATLSEFSASRAGRMTVLKGPITRISDGRTIWHSCYGGPVLARGGSGDLLAGIIGGLLAQDPAEPVLAALRGTAWHGLAADCWARSRGQIAVHTTELLDFMGEALQASRS